jgi:4-alpha-glucanotransferase
MAESRFDKKLKNVARAMGVLTRYHNDRGKIVHASSEVLRAILIGLGLDPSSTDRLEESHQAHLLGMRRRLCPPISIVKSDSSGFLEISVPEALKNKPILLTISREDGEDLPLKFLPTDLDVTAIDGHLGDRFLIKELPLPALPLGYHLANVEIAELRTTIMLVSAPPIAFSFDQEWGGEFRSWGLFVPHYAIRSRDNMGVGDVRDLKRVIDWVHERGGCGVATLPLLAPYHRGTEIEASPYSPCTRLFWNEILTCIDDLPEFASARVQSLYRSSDFQAILKHVRETDYVDYHRVGRLKHQLLRECALAFFEQTKDRHVQLENFVNTTPHADLFASFRALLHTDPDDLARGKFYPYKADPEIKRFYLYSQWMIQTQLAQIAGALNDRPVGLYLDLPLGTHPTSFDTQIFQEHFAKDFSIGAPPDSVFGKGQAWGFPPPHPISARLHHYQYFLEALRNHMRFAKTLRIDHIQGYHRLYWIPDGCSPDHGAYVQYNTHELYAILRLESQRHRTTLVGENLGTLPKNLNEELQANNIMGMHVLEYELGSIRKSIPTITRQQVVSLNTHDMFPFAAFVDAEDLAKQQQLKIMSDDQVKAHLQERQPDLKRLTEFLRQNGFMLDEGTAQDFPSWANAGAANSRLFLACLSYLSASKSPLLLINIEDLWLEREPQNVPSATQAPNWRHKLPADWEEIAHSKELYQLLARAVVNRAGECNARP